MTGEEIEKNFQEIWKLFKETDRRFKETDRRLDKDLTALQETVAALTGKWGRFVEGLIVPSVERLFEERNIRVEKVYQQVKTHKNGPGMEIDIFAIDGEYAVLIEAKSTLTVEDVNEHLERLANFKKFFPEYRDRKVIGAVAGIVLQEGVDRYAYKKGLFVIAEGGDTVKILNDRKFVPQTW